MASQLAASHGQRVNGVVLIGPIDPGDTLSTIIEYTIQLLQRSMRKVAPPAIRYLPFKGRGSKFSEARLTLEQMPLNQSLQLF